MEKKLKLELECPVCDKIPNSIPIPTCTKGHILCMECKSKIPFNRRMNDKPCPTCRSPLADNTNHMATSVISMFSDIPCTFKDNGCTFEGSIDDFKTHICQFRRVHCLVCSEECIMKDFLLHNNQKCFVKEPNNIFTFPPIWSDEFACGTGMFDCAL